MNLICWENTVLLEQDWRVLRENILSFLLKLMSEVSSAKALLDTSWWACYELRARDSFRDLTFPEFLQLLDAYIKPPRKYAMSQEVNLLIYSGANAFLMIGLMCSVSRMSSWFGIWRPKLIIKLLPNHGVRAKARKLSWNRCYPDFRAVWWMMNHASSIIDKALILTRKDLPTNTREISVQTTQLL